MAQPFRAMHRDASPIHNLIVSFLSDILLQLPNAARCLTPKFNGLKWQPSFHHLSGFWRLASSDGSHLGPHMTAVSASNLSHAKSFFSYVYRWFYLLGSSQLGGWVPKMQMSQKRKRSCRFLKIIFYWSSHHRAQIQGAYRLHLLIGRV